MSSLNTSNSGSLVSAARAMSAGEVGFVRDAPRLYARDPLGAVITMARPHDLNSLVPQGGIGAVLKESGGYAKISLGGSGYKVRDLTGKILFETMVGGECALPVATGGRLFVTIEPYGPLYIIYALQAAAVFLDNLLPHQWDGLEIITLQGLLQPTLDLRAARHLQSLNIRGGGDGIEYGVSELFLPVLATPAPAGNNLTLSNLLVSWLDVQTLGTLPGSFSISYCPHLEFLKAAGLTSGLNVYGCSSLAYIEIEGVLPGQNYFSTTYATTYRINDNGLGAAALNALFARLPDISAFPQMYYAYGFGLLDVAGNPGVTQAAYDPDIAIAKNWQIID